MDSQTLLSIVVDRSGSMETMGNEPNKAINSFVKEQQGDNVEISLLRFDHECDRFMDRVPSKEFNLTEEDIAPRGMTALYQAIGDSIEYTENIASNYDKIIFMIMTDGEENSSQGKFKGENGRRLVKEMITKHEGTEKWTFYFLGANIDSRFVGDSFGMTPDFCIDFTPDVKGCNSAIRSCSQAVYRSRTGEDGGFNDEERRESMSMGAPVATRTRARRFDGQGPPPHMPNLTTLDSPCLDNMTPTRNNGGKKRRFTSN